MNLRESLHTQKPPPLRVALLCSVMALWLATPAQAQSGGGTLPCGTAHVVDSGDTLSRLAERAYGDPALYPAIADANREVLGGDAGNVAVGMSLMIPCLDGGETSATSPAQAAAMRSAIAAEGTLTPDQLDTLFGPVALFPDPLLTPVLVAVTFPLDVVKAARFIEDNPGISDKERARLASAEPWDNSVRELAAGFPDVVTRMNDNIDWTEQAGEVVVAQTDDALAAIQRLRGKAQSNGYLVDNQAQKVEKVNDKIVIAPAEPNVVYVPTYDSQVVYSQPVTSPPVYHYGYDYNDNWSGWDDALVTGGIILGGAVLMDEIFDDDDWDGWDGDDDIDWDRGDITIDRGDRNIERGDRTVNIDRDRIEGGDRVRIGDRERIERDRGDLALGAGVGAAAGAALANRPEVRKSISNPADRAAARQKIETRKAKGTAPAKLDTTRKAKAQAQVKARAANPKASRPAAGTRSATAKKATKVSRPKANRAPVAHAPSRSNAFKKQAGGGGRAKASSNRGRASMGGRGGGRAGGGRGGGRRR